MKLQKLELRGHVDIRKIINFCDWLETKKQWERKYGISLPLYKELQNAEWGFDDMRIVTSPFSVVFDVEHDKQSHRFELKIYRDFLTDFGSTPRIARSLIDNDETAMIIPSIVHDAIFANKGFGIFSFWRCNELFRQMLIEQGMSRFRARLAYWAVSSFVGRKRWVQDRAAWEKAGVTCVFDRRFE